jgi:hypothetical protein
MSRVFFVIRIKCGRQPESFSLLQKPDVIKLISPTKSQQTSATFLMFRKLNKPQLTKSRQQNVIGIRAFDSRLYLDISRSFK